MPNLASTELCVGCTACVLRCPKQCLTLVYDEAGFAYPKMDKVDQCIKCNLCEKVCPVLNKKQKENEQTKVFSAFSLNQQIRENSSSGGIFTELALSVLSNKGIVYGAAYDEAWTVRHVAIEDEEQLHKLRGAKYTESVLNYTFSEIKQYLNSKRDVLFSGTPCQVAGLKSYLQHDYDNLLCVDFVCHGIPSPLAWKKYLEERKRIDGVADAPIKVNLRSKETGWSRYSYSYVIEYSDGKRYSALNSSDLYMKLFCNDYISRKSCKSCAFKGYERISDITLGDFWGIWDIDPEMDDGYGTSLILIHSDKGNNIFSNIADKVRYKESTLEAASRENTAVICPSTEKDERAFVLREIQNGNYYKLHELFT